MFRHLQLDYMFSSVIHVHLLWQRIRDKTPLRQNHTPTKPHSHKTHTTKTHMRQKKLIGTQGCGEGARKLFEFSSQNGTFWCMITEKCWKSAVKMGVPPIWSSPTTKSGAQPQYPRFDADVLHKCVAISLGKSVLWFWAALKGHYNNLQ